MKGNDGASMNVRPRLSLAQQVNEQIRSRILRGDFPPGARLPSEAELGEQYGVSRVTIRTAAKMLESQGLVDIRHGSGMFVSDFGGRIRAGLQELRSISATIEEMGFQPRIERHSLEYRGATEEESHKLGIGDNESVAEIRRTIYADNEVVAYSYDVVSRAVLKAGMSQELGLGSIFAALDKSGSVPVRSLAEIHAVDSEIIGWGEDRPTPPLYILLEQVHFDRAGQALFFSKTYFVEGRFQFVILRTR